MSFKMKIQFILMAVITAVSMPIHAEVFKCVGTNGNAVYQNTPCPKDEGVYIDLDKNTKMSMDEYKKNKKALEAAKRREEQEATSSSTYSIPSSTYIPSSSSGSRDVYVRGYTRKDGTYVRPYTRSRSGRR